MVLDASTCPAARDATSSEEASVKRGQCGFCARLDELSEHDRLEIEKFSQWLGIEHARRAGDEPAVLDMLEQAIYPEGIGRPPANGGHEA